MKVVRGDGTQVFGNTQSIDTDAQAFTSSMEIPKITDTGNDQMGGVWLEWEYAAGMSIDNFVLERADANRTNWSQVATPAGHETQYIDQDVAEAQTYWYRMKARGPSGESAYSNAFSVYVKPSSGSGGGLTPNLYTPTEDAGKIVLNWEFPSSEESRINGFDINRSTDGGTSWITVQTVAADQRSYRDQNFLSNARNDYEVCAMEGSSPHCSNTEWVDLRSGSGVSAPSLDPPSPRGGNEVELTWTFPDSEEPSINGFDVRRSSDGGSNWESLNIVSAISRSYIDNTYTSGTLYDYKVCAQDGSMEHCSNTRTFDSGGSAGGEAPDLDPPVRNGSMVDLTWTVSTSTTVDQFRIERSTDGTTWGVIATVDGANRSYTDTTAGDMPYSYQVCAIISGTAECSAPEPLPVDGLPPAFQGTGTMIRNQLAESDNRVYVDPHDSTQSGAAETVAPTSLEQFTLALSNGSETVWHIEDATRPGTWYVFLEDMMNPGQMILNGSQPVVISEQDYQARAE